MRMILRGRTGCGCGNSKSLLRLFFFLWTLCHGKNLNNNQRMIRGMTEDGECKFCGLSETNDHIFIFCNKAALVWNSCPVHFTVLHDFNFKDWLNINIRTQRREGGNLEDNVTFISVLWSLWKARNRFQFDNKLLRSEEVVMEATYFARNVALASTKFYSSFTQRACFNSLEFS